MTDQVNKENVPSEIIGKWRKAISCTEDANGKLRAYRFMKDEEKWKPILFFTEPKDMMDFAMWALEMALKTGQPKDESIAEAAAEQFDKLLEEYAPHLIS